MADWTRPFASAYRFVRVSRETGYELGQVDGIRDGSLTINQDTATFEEARADTAAVLDVGSDLIRCYLDATWEDGTAESVCLGTWLASIPSRKVHGSVDTCSAILSGRLVELEEDSFSTPIVAPAGSNVMAYAKGICESAGLEVVATDSSATLGAAWAFGLDDSSDSDGGSKLEAVNALMRIIGYGSARTDPMGRVVLAPLAVASASAPSWTFREGLSATFLDKADEERDSSDVCNVVLTIYETDESTVIGEAVDDDPASPYSTVTIGRRKVAKYAYRDTATQAQADAKAEELLRTQQSTIRRVKLKHVWCGARVGDVVEVDWPSARISGRYIVRTQEVEIGSAGCLTTSELRAYERRTA